MREELAAGYVGLSKGSFRTEVGAGRAAAPVRITVGRIIWLCEALDKWLDDLAGKPASGGADKPPIEAAVSEWDAALGLLPDAPPPGPPPRMPRRRAP